MKEGIYVINENKPLKMYIEEKISMLKEEFLFKLTAEEIAHFRELKSEIAVDQYARTILKSRL